MAVLALLASACASAEEGERDRPETVFGGSRPVALRAPARYDPATEFPLVLLLHGYSEDGPTDVAYLHFEPLVESAGILLAAPDGLLDSSWARFWNATPACCDFDGVAVDDEAYLRGLLADIRAAWTVDPARVYVVGYSNGGFMAHRMACNDAAEIAGIVSLAGETFLDPGDCNPTEPVSVLQIQGDADSIIPYGGGELFGMSESFPGAVDTVTHWQDYDGCAAGLVGDPGAIDLDRSIAGPETSVRRFAGCERESGVELWTIQGADHGPDLGREFAAGVWQWLAAHPKSRE